MRKTALAIFGALLISGLAVPMAAASQHHRSKPYFGRDLSDYRGAYNELNGPASVPVYVAPRVPNRSDPSRPGGEKTRP